MTFFYENGNPVESEDFYDSQGNLVGHFIKKTGDSIGGAFETSWVWGIIFLLFIAPGWTILGLLVIGIYKLIKLLFKLIFAIVKFVFRLAWWVVRLPFCLIFRRKTPTF